MVQGAATRPEAEHLTKSLQDAIVATPDYPPLAVRLAGRRGCRRWHGAVVAGARIATAVAVLTMAISCSTLTGPPPDACAYTDYVESTLQRELRAHVIAIGLDPKEFNYLPMLGWRPLDGGAGCAGTVRRPFFPLPDYAADAMICDNGEDFDYRITPAGTEPLTAQYDACKLMLSGRP